MVHYLGFGILINGPQYFTHPSGIAIDSKDNVFVVDFDNPNYAIKEFDKNGAFNRSLDHLVWSRGSLSIQVVWV
jgi:hypothetical protein